MRGFVAFAEVFDGLRNPRTAALHPRSPKVVVQAAGAPSTSISGPSTSKRALRSPPSQEIQLLPRSGPQEQADDDGRSIELMHLDEIVRWIVNGRLVNELRLALDELGIPVVGPSG